MEAGWEPGPRFGEMIAKLREYEERVVFAIRSICSSC